MKNVCAYTEILILCLLFLLGFMNASNKFKPKAGRKTMNTLKGCSELSRWLPAHRDC